MTSAADGARDGRGVRGMARGARWVRARAVQGVARGARWVRAVRWYLRELTGEAEYDRYCERHRRHHPLAPIPTRREYQTLRSRHREEHPQSRCC